VRLIKQRGVADAQARDAQLKSEAAKLQAGRDILKNATAYLIEVKFGFVAKHRGIWPAE
jgi:hypothetical protein